MAKFTPTLDASMGLIFRLNILWQNIDRKALTGDMEGWNFALDRIYCNLLYRGEIEIEYEDEDETKIKEICISKEEKMIYDKFREKIRQVKKEKAFALKNKKRSNYNFSSEEHYQILMTKDVWLRKLMQERKLYLKEIEFDAGRAIFGG